ncbi:LAME_0B02762g1_1 [Lachancea meyersii CBS 8951]|uniref:LAME_0B02762g1_1 n=1 Tax=Lachancea meyersii CBS 8951 TaxID=1266667 RepID=A0A1G4IUD9_9SACH|nr:LAME_0B02762g1_1 [Lachancea meyersii CBS 8951]
MEGPNPFADGVQEDDYESDFQRLDSPPPVLPSDTGNAKINPASNGQYADLYHVDLDTLKSRLKAALIAQKIDQEGPFRPDLYAPVWVTMTAAAAHFYVRSLLVLIMSLIEGHIPSIMSRTHTIIPYMAFAFSYVSVSPALVHVLAKFVFKIKSDWGLVELVSLYGYSMTIWVALAAVNIVFIPLQTVLPNLFSIPMYWTRIMVGVIHTAFFFYRQFKTDDESDLKKLYITVVAVSALSAVILKLMSNSLT